MLNNKLRMILVAAIMACSAFTGASAQTWNLYTYISTASIAPGEAMQTLANRVKEQTGGALTLRVHLGGSLPIKATNITQAVSRGGTIQIADDGFPYGNIPIAGILNLPMLLPTEQQFEKAVAVMRPYLLKAFEKQGIEVLAIYHYPQQVLWARKKLTSFSDLKDLKIRVSSPQQAAFIEAFGGIPITLGTPEVAPALQRGVVDGAITASTGGGSIWKDLLTHTYRLGPNYFTSYILVNKNQFDALDPKVKTTLREIAGAIGQETTDTLRDNEASVTKKMADDGMVVTPARQADVKQGVKRMAAYWGKWAAKQGPETVEALKKVRAAINQ